MEGDIEPDIKFEVELDGFILDFVDCGTVTFGAIALTEAVHSLERTRKSLCSCLNGTGC